MGSFNKKYIIREAEYIIEECRKKINKDNKQNNIIKLKIINKKLKRKIFLQKIEITVLSIICVIGFLV